MSAYIRSLLIFQLQVNIIPIIAKSDAISKSELAKFKIKITSELVSNGVQIYQFPTDDESVAEINSTMNVRVTTGFLSTSHSIYPNRHEVMVIFWILVIFYRKQHDTSVFSVFNFNNMTHNKDRYILCLLWLPGNHPIQCIFRPTQSASSHCRKPAVWERACVNWQMSQGSLSC